MDSGDFDYSFFIDVNVLKNPMEYRLCHSELKGLDFRADDLKENFKSHASVRLNGTQKMIYFDNSSEMHYFDETEKGLMRYVGTGNGKNN